MTKNDKSIIVIGLGLLISLLLTIFLFRVTYSANFDLDGSINNLDTINVSTSGLFSFFGSLPNYFNSCVNTLLSFDLFRALADQTSDIWLIGGFLNFMSQVFTFIVYIVSACFSVLQYLIEILKYLFSIENVSINETVISIPNVG